jgi:hypothetical protein
MGKFPIEDLVERPPYHPNCECEVIYYIDWKDWFQCRVLFFRVMMLEIIN